jgi:hypothetical protein
MEKTTLLNNSNNYVYLIIGLFIIILTIAVFLIMFNVPIMTSYSTSPSIKSSQEIVSNTLLILFFVFILLTVSIYLLPSLKDFKNFLSQIKNVTYVIFYTIFLILFFRLMPSSIINNYANIITPITIVISLFMFYMAFKQNYIEEFNVNYERIKTIILFICLITLFFIYYITDPGGYITQYFGYSLLLTIILSIFSLLYLIILLTIPEQTKSAQNTKYHNLLQRFSSFSVWGGISFLIFLIVTSVGIYESGLISNLNLNDSVNNLFSVKTACVFIIFLILLILWTILLIFNVFPDFPSIPNMAGTEKINFYKKGLLILFGLVISGVIITWIIYNIQNLSSTSSIISLILNIFLILIVIGLIYKTIFVQLPYGNTKKNAFFSLITNIIFYIPCLFASLFTNGSPSDFLNTIKSWFMNEYNSTTKSSLIILFIAIILLVVYFTFPSLYNKINLQGGKLLVNHPVYTNKNYSLGTYKDLNGNENFEYQYAISFWFFLDAVPPNTNSNSSQYTSILNFGNKPNILYNTQTNSLVVTMPTDIKIYNTDTDKSQLTNLDENENTILYKNDKVLLQKWNNMIINYNGGVLDIFLNGELVKSGSGIVPYYTLDNLTIGEDDGVRGGICNVVYFKKTLTSTNIYYLYNMVKNFSPPIVEKNNLTVIKDNLTINSDTPKNITGRNT